MSQKSDRLFAEFWQELTGEMEARGIEPCLDSIPSKAETILEMIGSMLLDDHLFVLMRGRYYDLLLPPHPDFGKKIKEAKRKGDFPRIEILVGDQIDKQDDGHEDSEVLN